ncbi:MAG: PEP-CTERM sorting domain-containing protein [Acetobacteraceae bacterium]|jgi:hypothetical protein
MFRFAVHALAVCALFIGGSASAQQILFDNLNVSQSGSYLAVANYDQTGDGPLAASFLTGPTGKINDVQLLLGGDPTNTDGAIQIALFSDAGYVPDALVAQIGTLDDKNLLNSGSFTVYDFPVAIVGLSADTRYWIELSDLNGDPASDPTSILWSLAADATGTGVMAEWWYGDGAAYPNWYNNPLDYQDSGNPFGGDTAFQMLVSAPEPASMSLVGLGLVALGAVRRRRRS